MPCTSSRLRRSACPGRYRTTTASYKPHDHFMRKPREQRTKFPTKDPLYPGLGGHPISHFSVALRPSQRDSDHDMVLHEQRRLPWLLRTARYALHKGKGTIRGQLRIYYCLGPRTRTILSFFLSVTQTSSACAAKASPTQNNCFLGSATGAFRLRLSAAVWTINS